MYHTLKNYFSWILFFILAGCATLGTFYFFPKAFPIIHLNLTMDRAEALKEAQYMATQFSLGPTDYRTGASFHTDTLTKTFVELEAGGKEAFEKMMADNLYQPFTWQIRHFKEYEKNEIRILFTPDGRPYGFTETLSENTPGAALSSEQAQTIAENIVQSNPWNINLSAYTLVETSHEKVQSDRVDHQFVYQRTNETIGEAFYRLKVTVSGDKVSTINHFVKTPDNFLRRYIEMRSSNETIAQVAQIALLILYVLGGCIGGLLFLLNINWIIWQPAFYWALGIAILSSLDTLNRLPLSWMYYSTQIASYAFLAQQFMMMLMLFLFWSITLIVSFAAAEGLTRKAFGTHLQFWTLWQRTNASSYAVLGRTIGGFLLVPFALLFTSIFFTVTITYLNWWIPSSALINPDILATYCPWLESIALSLRAGFWEECLFRAVPLAGAALIGSYFNRRNTFIALGFIIQILIFGAAHANYPAQPAYARVIELIFISSLFGGVYLRFGLLTSIITHFVYDVVWFSLPLFVSTAPLAWLNKLMVIMLSTLPLWIVLIQRIRTKKWHILHDDVNKNWKPAPQSNAVHTMPPTQYISFSKRMIRNTFFIGLISLVAWMATTQFQSDGTKFIASRSAASETATSWATSQDIVIPDWYTVTCLFQPLEQHESLSLAHRFIWQNGGKNLYTQLLGTYLPTPLWVTKLLKFNGSISERAENYEIMITPDNALFRVIHKLAEDTPGKELSKNDAQSIAIESIQTRYGLTSNDLNTISATSQKHPHRLDWKFVFSVPKDYPLAEGQARIEVAVSGDMVTDMFRFIHVPEQWERSQQNIIFIANIIKQMSTILAYLIILMSSLFSLAYWKSNNATRNTLILFGIIGFIFVSEFFNSWPTIVASFNTSQPFRDQLFQYCSLSILALLIRSGIFAILINFLNRLYRRYECSAHDIVALAGATIGITYAMVQSVCKYLMPSTEPIWPNYSALGYIFPSTAGIDSYLLHYISITIFFLIFTQIINTLTHYWAERKLLGAGLMLLLGFIMSGLMISNNIALWALMGGAFGILSIGAYQFYVHTSMATVPIITASYLMCLNIQQLFFNGFPDAITISLGSLFVLSGVSFLWSRELMRKC